MKILVQKTPSGLKPCYDSDYENYSKIPQGETFEIEYIKKRNIKFHRKFFSLIKLAFENQSDYNNLNDLRRDLTISAGYYTQSINKVTGEVYTLAKSISFNSMDEIEFNEVYEATKNVICKWIGITSEQVEEEILQYY